MYETVVVGSGPAGLNAALYLKRADKNVVIIEKENEIVRKDVWQVVLASGKIIETETLIYAAGAVPRKLGIPGEKLFQGKGISYCAYCDGSLFKGKDVAVIGGGNTALEDALYLSDLCRKVYLIHRRKEFKGNNATVELLKKRKNVEMILKAAVQKACGQKKLEEIILDSGEKIHIAGLFVAIGMRPLSDMIKDYVQRTEGGYVIA